MSSNKKVCIFNKNHLIGNQTLENHYANCHPKEYLYINENGLYCRTKRIFFKNQIEMDKHISNCSVCQLYLGENQNIDKNGDKTNDRNKDNSHSKKKKNKIKKNLIDISMIGMAKIEEKMPTPKKIRDFPTFDFDKYKKNNKINNLDPEIINSLIEEEKNLV